jgi:hypothetical protein
MKVVKFLASQFPAIHNDSFRGWAPAHRFNVRIPFNVVPAGGAHL